jgi:endonuclease/exonuclease/phosphatase family metal-dependent hydrolase
MILTIFNINMWLLPFRISKHNKKRLKSLMEYIRQKNPDIITLQEIWDIKHINFLRKNLPEYHFEYTPRKRLNFSGLATLSRYKPASMEFFPFKKNKSMIFIEKSVLKGVLKTEYKIEGKKIIILNTHLYAPLKGKVEKETKKQLEFTKSKINTKGTIFLCGDLNLEKKDFEKINKGFFKYAEREQNTFSSENRYVKKWWDRKAKHDTKIDYILAKTDNKIYFRSQTVKEPLSDHYGIYTKVELKK